MTAAVVTHWPEPRGPGPSPPVMRILEGLPKHGASEALNESHCGLQPDYTVQECDIL